MKKNAKSALALTLAIAGAVASPMRSDVMALAPTTVQSGVASNEARAEVRGCVVRVAGGRRGSSSNGTDRITSTVSQGSRHPRNGLASGSRIMTASKVRLRLLRIAYGEGSGMSRRSAASHSAIQGTRLPQSAYGLRPGKFLQPLALKSA